jgi:hypothetical protein
VFREHLATPRVDLDLPPTSHAGALEPKIKSADAGKEATERHAFLPPLRRLVHLDRI